MGKAMDDAIRAEHEAIAARNATKHEISDVVVQSVMQALNAAIGLASVHSPTLRTQFLEAAYALDDAINGADENE